MENNYEMMQEPEKKGSIIGGIIGALLGAAIGAVAWTLIGMAGYIASIIGFVIAFLADKGYDLLKGRQGVIKMIVLIVCVVLAVGAGTLGTWVWTAHNEYQTQLSELSEIEKKYYDIMTEEEFMKEIFADSEVQGEMLKDCGMGLVFGILGSFGLIAAAKNGKKQQAAPVQSNEVEFNEAALEMARVNPEAAAEQPAEESADKNLEA